MSEIKVVSEILVVSGDVSLEGRYVEPKEMDVQLRDFMSANQVDNFFDLNVIHSVKHQELRVQEQLHHQQLLEHLNLQPE